MGMRGAHRSACLEFFFSTRRPIMAASVAPPPSSMRAHARRLLLLALASQLMTVEARSRLAKSRAKSVAEARAEAEELTAATKEAGMQHLSAAAAGKRKPCYSLNTKPFILQPTMTEKPSPKSPIKIT